ncbi:MAG: SDR family oxidoreductase [Acetobacteraceae bacterium]
MTEKRVPIVTGAARGIGYTTTQALAQSGFALALLDQDESGARAAAAALDTEALAIGCDISDLAGHDGVLARIADRFGRIDCLVNNTGVVSPERLDYCIAKAGLAMFVQGLAVRLAPHRTAVFEVRPGIIRTDMTRLAAERYENLIRDGVVPVRRWGEPADVASVIAGLASSTIYATGSVLNVDSGLAIARF